MNFSNCRSDLEQIVRLVHLLLPVRADTGLIQGDDTVRGSCIAAGFRYRTRPQGRNTSSGRLKKRRKKKTKIFGLYGSSDTRR